MSRTLFSEVKFLAVGVGTGMEGWNAVLKAKPIINDINANLNSNSKHNFQRCRSITHIVAALTGLACSDTDLVTVFLGLPESAWNAR